MSKLLSLSNSNSKNNSYNANGSKESKNSQKKNNFSYGSFNKSKGGEISSGTGSIESNNANITNSNNTNSNSNSNSISNNNGHTSKNSITAKRKKFYDKLMKKELTKIPSNHNLNGDNINLNKGYDSEKINSMKNVQNNQSTSSNINITNNTNIIVNVKSGTKSLDIRALNNNSNKDMIMRDMRELHIITKKAICSISTINPLLDTLDNFNETNKPRNYSNNKILNKKPMKEFLINDNTDYSINQLLINNLTIDKKFNCSNNPNININFNSNNKQTSSQIINIININGGNYSMDQTKRPSIKNIPRKDLSSIKECSYDTPYMAKPPPYIQKKNLKNQPYEVESKNFNVIKQCKTKINKINKLSNKKYNYNNWHGNTINAISSKGENNNGGNKIVKKYIEHLRNSNKAISSNTYRKGTFIDINKNKIK